MPTIRVDQEVFDALQQRGTMGDSFNDVVRDLLRLPRHNSDPTAPTGNYTAGTLGPLLRAGLLQDGQTLTWYRPRRREVHTVTVDANGCLVTADGGICTTPNTAATAVAGHPYLGWSVWRTADGDTLDQLRDRLSARSTTPATPSGQTTTTDGRCPVTNSATPPPAPQHDTAT